MKSFLYISLKKTNLTITENVRSHIVCKKLTFKTLKLDSDNKLVEFVSLR